MKRFNGIYEKFCTRTNLEQAEKNARKHKESKHYVKTFDINKDAKLDALEALHKSGNFKTSRYRKKVIQEKKTRVLGILPYYPDRIRQHAIINVIKPIWVPSFTACTYSNLKGHGLHQCAMKLQYVLRKDPKGTQYCLQTDLVQHYPTMSHDVLKTEIRRKIKDNRMLRMMDEIIDSTDGLPLGNPLSGYLENVALNRFDHKVKEVYKVKYYFRLVDDMVFLAEKKEELHRLLPLIKADLEKMNMVIKPNWQIYKVASRGIDFLGYRFFHGYTLLRDSIKKNIFRKISDYRKGKITEDTLNKSLASWTGWIKWCNSYRLQQKIIFTLNKAKQFRERTIQ